LGVVILEEIGIAVRTEGDVVLVSVFLCCGNRVNVFFLTGSLDFNGREDDSLSDEVILTRIGATIAAAVTVEGEVLLVRRGNRLDLLPRSDSMVRFGDNSVVFSSSAFLTCFVGDMTAVGCWL